MDFGSILSTITDVANTAGAVVKAVGPAVQQASQIIANANQFQPQQPAQNHVFQPQVITATPQPQGGAKDNTLLYVAGAGVLALLFLKK